MSSTPFTLQPITESDIPTLISIFTAAFSKDANTQVKLIAKDPNSQANGMAMGIQQWLNYPDRVSLLKAVDTSTGTIMGWVGWARRGYEDQVAPPTPKTEKEEIAQQPEPDSEITKVDIKDHAARLEALTDADMSRWIAKIMPSGTKCRYLVSCVVHPAYQGRGVGSALIGWGTEKADKEGVFCWVHSSDGGHVAFGKAGFMEVERLVVDLDEFAEEKRWGEYVFRYMVRQPVGREY